MKHTYDKKNIEFTIGIRCVENTHETYYEFPFDDVDGTTLVMDGYSICPEFTLEGRMEFDYQQVKMSDARRYQTCTFQMQGNSNIKRDLRIEDIIKRYIFNNFSSFDNLHKIYALAFLERYCFDFDEISVNDNKDVIKIIQKRK